ncbi:MAG TPA: ATP-binding cassette domain-containing protein [Candidatus Binatia bacterium]
MPVEIQAERLRKTFGATVAVHEVTFSIERGEVVGFLGPNGAGKSTTLRMLTGVFPPTSGRATIAGHDVVRDSIAARRALGYLPERTALYGEMPVRRYLEFIADMKGVAKRDVTRAVERAMGAAGIEKVSHRLVGNLSKGYRQRVGIAQALIGDPPVLILDEPTSGLDPEQVTEIRALVRNLGSERTVILSTHILPEVETICSRVIIMNRGRILAVDSPARLEEHLRPYREFSVTAVGARDGLIRALRAVPHVVDAFVDGEEGEALRLVVRCEHGYDVRREIAGAVVGGGFGLVELKPVVMTLEEIFLTLVGDQREAPPVEEEKERAVAGR